MNATKNDLWWLIGVIFYSSICFSQTDSVLSLYPLQTGNQWQYRTTFTHGYWGGGIDKPDTYHVVRVAGDTVQSNGKTYKVVECAGEMVLLHPRYQRIDSLTMQVFRYDTSAGGKEYLMDTLRGNKLTWYHGSRLLAESSTLIEKLDTQTVFGVRSFCRTFLTGNPNNVPSLRYTLARGFGILSGSYSLPGFDMYGGDRYDDWLVYAKIAGQEYGTFVSVNRSSGNPFHFRLMQNYPNPFNPTTKISFEIDRKSMTSLQVYDLLGRKVATLIDGYCDAGQQHIEFDASGMKSGVYFCRLTVGGYSIVRKMILLR